MRKNLFLLAILSIFIFFACSKDDNDDSSKTPITKSAITGEWSTGVKNIHKYIEFESDGTGFYALFNGADMGQNYLFSYEVSNKTISIKITYSETEGLAGKTKLWNCSLSGNRLTIENETENGVYKKIE